LTQNQCVNTVNLARESLKCQTVISSLCLYPFHTTNQLGESHMCQSVACIVNGYLRGVDYLYWVSVILVSIWCCLMQSLIHVCGWWCRYWGVGFSSSRHVLPYLLTSSGISVAINYIVKLVAVVISFW